MSFGLALPPDRRELRRLTAGQEVLLSGPVYTARDATHARLAEELERTGRLPWGLDGQVLFYAGPTPARPGYPAGSAGPTTSKRMDAWTPALLDAGIVATIGKGPRSGLVALACARDDAVYFSAVGGAAALLGSRVRAAEVVAYPELGAEALMRLELEEFPVIVAIDTRGGDIYAEPGSAGGPAPGAAPGEEER